MDTRELLTEDNIWKSIRQDPTNQQWVFVKEVIEKKSVIVKKRKRANSKTDS